MHSDNLITNSTPQLEPKGSKDNKKKHAVIKEEFFQLCNNKDCIKRILYNYFAEPNHFISSNTDADFCCSYCNSFLELKVPKCTIYRKRGAALNIQKNYILNKLKAWAENSVLPKVIEGFRLFPKCYTATIPHNILNQIACQSHLITTCEHLNKYITN